MHCGSSSVKSLALFECYCQYLTWNIQQTENAKCNYLFIWIHSCKRSFFLPEKLCNCQLAIWLRSCLYGQTCPFWSLVRILMSVYTVQLVTFLCLQVNLCVTIKPFFFWKQFFVTGMLKSVYNVHLVRGQLLVCVQEVNRDRTLAATFLYFGILNNSNLCALE